VDEDVAAPQESSRHDSSDDDNADQDDDEPDHENANVDSNSEELVGSEEGQPESRPTKKKSTGAVLFRLNSMGRASYCTTDSYAPKSSRLSILAPRPHLDETAGLRQSSRRKIPPLQYWRHERVEYARATGAAVPEIVDLVIRSPEPTPNWVRRRRAGRTNNDEEADNGDQAEAGSAEQQVSDKSKRKRGKDTSDEAPRHEGKKVRPTHECGATKSKRVRAVADGVQLASEDGASAQPVRRRSPFFAFCAARRAEVVTSRPDLDVTGQARNISSIHHLPRICFNPSVVPHSSVNYFQLLYHFFAIQDANNAFT
jgi:hypothetical protein